MLVGTPFPVNLSAFEALGRKLWIRRVLVRSQEGQLRGPLGKAGGPFVCPFRRATFAPQLFQHRLAELIGLDFRCFGHLPHLSRLLSGTPAPRSA